MELPPRDRMGLGTHAQEAAKRGYSVDDMSADLFYDEALDGPDLLAVRVVNSGALNVIALDQRVARNRRGIRLCHSTSPPVFGSTARRIGEFPLERSLEFSLIYKMPRIRHQGEGFDPAQVRSCTA